MKYAMTTLLLALVLVTGCSVQPSKTPLKPKPAEKKQEFVIKDTKWLDDLGFTDAQIREALASHDTPGLAMDKHKISEFERIVKEFSRDKTAKPWIIIAVSDYHWAAGTEGGDLWEITSPWPFVLYLVGYEGDDGSNSLYVQMETEYEGEPYQAGRGRQPFVEGLGASVILLDRYFGDTNWSYQVSQETSWVIGNDGKKTAGIFLGPLTHLNSRDYYAMKKGIVPGHVYEGLELKAKVLESNMLADYEH